MLTNQESLSIQVETTPPGLAVSTVVAGADATKLKKLTDWSYEFTRPDPAPTTPVSIVFQLSANPSALAVLRIDFEGTTEMPPEADPSAQPSG